MSTKNRKDSSDEGNEDGSCKRLLSSFSTCRRRGSVGIAFDQSEKTGIGKRLLKRNM